MAVVLFVAGLARFVLGAALLVVLALLVVNVLRRWTGPRCARRILSEESSSGGVRSERDDRGAGRR